MNKGVFDFRDDDGEPLMKSDSAGDFMKAHVKGFARKDGAYVPEHDDKRKAAEPKGEGKPGVPAHVATVTAAMGGSGWKHGDGKSTSEQAVKWNGSSHIGVTEVLHDHGFTGTHSDNEREEYSHPDGHVATIKREKGSDSGELSIKH